MSFSFGFTSNDFDEDDELIDSNENSAIDTHANNGNATIEQATINPLDSAHLLQETIQQPALEDIKSCLESLKDIRLSFEQISTPETNSTLYRRELFDIKHQLMSENIENAGTTDNDNELDILINEDLKKNVYEGGLKSWECSLDLVDFMASNQTFDLTKMINIVELGCGTALPSEYVFAQYLNSGLNNGLKIILADYNSSALRLASIPNMIISWAKLTLSSEKLTSLQRSNDENIPIVDDELLLTESLLTYFFEDMQKRNVEFHIISGTWGRQFSNILDSLLLANSTSIPTEILVLTSETIYQPENLPIISETLIDLKSKYHVERHIPTTILVAAKDIYFGVGGSILEFQKYLGHRNIKYSTFKVNAGLKRSIVSLD